MKQYYVTWEIDLDAESYEDAAAQALVVQRDPDSIATCFEVWERDKYGCLEDESKSLDASKGKRHDHSKI